MQTSPRHRPGTWGPVFSCRCGCELQVYSAPQMPFGRKIEVLSGQLHRCPLNAPIYCTGVPRDFIEELVLLAEKGDIAKPHPDPKQERLTAEELPAFVS